MKKILLISVIIAAIFTSCDDAVIETLEGNTISFDNAFVDLTRATDISVENLTNFYVHAWMYDGDQSTCIFGKEGEYGTLVSKNSNNAWTYDGGGRYWFTNKTYHFLAFAPINAQYNLNNDHSSFTYTNSKDNATTDLIVAKVERTTAADKLTAQDIAPVSLHFQHLLSRVVFKFINDFPVGDVKLLISDIRLSGAAKSGVFSFYYDIDNNNNADANSNSNANADANNGADENNTDNENFDNNYSNNALFGQWVVDDNVNNHMNPEEAINIVFPIKNSKTPNLRTSPYIEISNISNLSTSNDFNEGGDGYEQKSEEGDVTVGENDGDEISDFSNPILSADGFAISQQFYIIPEFVNYEKYYISFKIIMTQGEVQIGEFAHNVPLNQINFIPGNAYCLTASFNNYNVNPDNEIKPIEFNISVTPWGEDVQNEIF